MIEGLPYDVIEAVLDSLPVEISFVDEEDKVRYFNKNGESIFPRSRAIIGRKFQDCHLKKSVHVVNKLLEDLKTKKRDFAVRNPNEEYLGCLEVTQDITDIQKIRGEKRLLDY